MTKLEIAKINLAQAQDNYCFAIARGDWNECALAKRQVNKYFAQVGKLVRQQMKTA